VPLAEPIYEFFKREVLPHVPDAWIDTAKPDPKDGRAGSSATRSTSTYFYRYKPPRAGGRSTPTSTASERYRAHAGGDPGSIIA
jgi:hypothetical protein